MISVDTVIVGGGVSGLITAHALRAEGHSVLVLERQVRPGGNAISERIGGFLMEHGPSTVNLGMRGIAELAEDLDLGNVRTDLGRGVRKRYLTKNGQLAGIGLHPLAFLTSGYLSWAGRARMAAELWQPRGDPDAEETVAEFGQRRFGAEFAERVLDPLVSGMFAGDARQTELGFVMPALAAMERAHGSVIRAVLRARLRGGRMPARQLSSWREGIGTLPSALALRLGNSVKTGVTVRRIARTRHGFAVDSGDRGRVHARAVVVATQPHVAAQMFAQIAPGAADECARIAAPPLAVVFLGYRRDQVAHPLDGLGYLTPGGEERIVNGGLFCSTMFAGRAPANHVAIAAYIGGARAPDHACLTADTLISTVRREFADLVGARGDPVVARVRQWPRGLPQFRRGHSRLVERLEQALSDSPGMYVTGNYLRGPSVGACADCALDTARRVSLYLGQATETAFRIGGSRTGAVATANPQCR
ncbi:MAG: protoporphyrinogen oxidase [Rhizobiaceae bacterium]|nr:MAG: protoporphyrinogen oxidase [Rhizobiaceae bacterium]CAG0948618.1 protoporphyrinogen/coproporphyrinogen III oxidase [Rhizobiaceae bacterium]